MSIKMLNFKSLHKGKFSHDVFKSRWLLEKALQPVYWAKRSSEVSLENLLQAKGELRVFFCFKLVIQLMT